MHCACQHSASQNKVFAARSNVGEGIFGKNYRRYRYYGVVGEGVRLGSLAQLAHQPKFQDGCRSYSSPCSFNQLTMISRSSPPHHCRRSIILSRVRRSSSSVIGLPCGDKRTVCSRVECSLFIAGSTPRWVQRLTSLQQSLCRFEVLKMPSIRQIFVCRYGTQL